MTVRFIRRTTALMACGLLTILVSSCSGAGRQKPNADNPTQSPSPGQQEPPPPGMEPLMQGQNDFGSRLLAGLLADSPESNIAVSPPSVTFALAMAWNGARGATREAIGRVLGFADMDPDQVNRLNAALLERLAVDDDDIQLAVANALWVRESFPLAEEFVRVCVEQYRARATELDFGDAAAPGIINDWVSEQTRGRITSIIEQLDDMAALVLVNAVYFKGNWSVPFDEELTRDREFRRVDGGRPMVPMMERDDRFRYSAADGLQVVQLPYGDGGFSFYVLLPDADDPAGLVENLSAGYLDQRLSNLASMKGRLVLPRFRLEFGRTLNEVLKRMNMAVAFDPQQADFRDMLATGVDAELFINSVMHKSFVEVNETGTEAAAATAVEMTVTAMPVEEERFQMVCDRPFLWLIREETTGSVLFIGVVYDPS